MFSFFFTPHFRAVVIEERFGLNSLILFFSPFLF